MTNTTDALAAYIRLVDGDHQLGAAQLAEKITDMFALVVLPAPAEPDDEGRAYYDAADIRVDYSGTDGPRVRDDYHDVTPEQLRIVAAEYLAAARDVEAQAPKRCRRCGCFLPNHGLVHVRNGNGGGYNKPCPDASADPDVEATRNTPAPQHTTRVCIDADCPNCEWPERWADLDLTDQNTPPTFGCNKCDYRSNEREA